MIRLRILKWRDYPGGPSAITRVFIRGERRVRVREDNAMTGAKERRQRSECLEEGAVSQGQAASRS